MRWECRYSSCEMLYFEITGGEVLEYFDHNRDNATHWSFADVMAGRIDGDVRNMFGGETLAEIKAAVSRAMKSGGEKRPDRA